MKRLLPGMAERCRTWTHRPQCEYLSRGVPVSDEIGGTPLCACSAGADGENFGKEALWRQLAPRVTRLAISPLFAVSCVETVAASLPDFVARSLAQGDKCARCNSAGKPKLLVCARCKLEKYCSSACQRDDWKRHKVSCSAVPK